MIFGKNVVYRPDRGDGFARGRRNYGLAKPQPGPPTDGEAHTSLSYESKNPYEATATDGRRLLFATGLMPFPLWAGRFIYSTRMFPRNYQKYYHIPIPGVFAQQKPHAQK
jgi:hypothetical protein